MAEWLDVLQSAGIVVSLGIGGFQALRYVNQLKAQAYTWSVGQWIRMYGWTISNPELQEGAMKPYVSLPYPTPQHALVSMYMTFFETMFALRNKRFIEQDVWDAWARTLEMMVALPYYRGYWEETKFAYPQGFKEFVEGLLTKLPKTPAAA